MIDTTLQKEFLQFWEILKLCGYSEISQFFEFGYSNFDTIENYVRNFAIGLSVKQRMVYMNETFANNPNLFTINPLLKSEIIKVCETLTAQMKLNRIMGTRNMYSGLFNFKNFNFVNIQSGDTIHIEDQFLSAIQMLTSGNDDNGVQAIEEDPKNKNTLIIEEIDNIPINDPDVPLNSEKVTHSTEKNVPSTAEENNDIPTKNKNSFLDLSFKSETSGINSSSCIDHHEDKLLLADDVIHKMIVKLSSTKIPHCNLRIKQDFDIYNSVTDKTLGYFFCKLCPPKSSEYKRCKFRYYKTGSIIFTNIHTHLNIHFPTARNTLTPKPRVVRRMKEIEQENTTMADEKSHDYVIRMAESNFQSCHLKVNDDFLLLMDTKDQFVGYFVCKFCARDSLIKHYFKFRRTFYDSINFTNIKTHLLHHFKPSDKCPKERGRKRKSNNN